MGRLGWAIILGSLFGAILFGIVQRGCSAEADGSRVVVVPTQPTGFEKDLQQAISAAPAATPNLAPPPSPVAGRPRGVSPITRAAPAPIQRVNPGETAEEAEARRNQMREDRRIALEQMRRNLQTGNGTTARRTIPAGVIPDAQAGGSAAEFEAPIDNNPGFVDNSDLAFPVARMPTFDSLALARQNANSSEGADIPSIGSSDATSDSGSALGGSGDVVSSGLGGFTTGGGNTGGNNNGGGNTGGNNNGSGGNTGTGAAVAPGAFSLVTPANSASGILLTPTFTWQAASTATSYRLQVAADSAFASILFDSGSITGTSIAIPTGALEPGLTVFWRVTASNTAGATVSGSTFSFITAKAPGAFTLSTPAVNGPAATLPVTLTWTSSTDASSYLITVARDSAFTDVVLTETSLASTSLAIPAEILEEGKTYYWKVLALNAVGAVAAAPASASFRVLGAPGEFALLTPAPETTDLFIPVPLAWTPAIDAASYRLEVATDAAFSNRVVNIGGLTTTSFLLTSEHVQPGTTYFWRVTASNAVDVRGSSPGSSSFSTLPGPGDFALVGPGDGGVGTRPVTLQWQESTGALLYTVELSSNASFTNIIATQLVIPLIDGASWTIPDALLTLNKTYFWRVTAENIVGRKQAIISPFSFTVREADYDVNKDGAVNVRDLYAFHALPNPKPDLNLDGLADDNDRLGLRASIRGGEPADVAGN